MKQRKVIVQRLFTRGRYWIWWNFSHVARLEGARALLTYATLKGFKVYQMDAKSIFLSGILEEEVYIETLEDFVDPRKRDMIYKLQLYGLKQAPWAWYERLYYYLLKTSFQRMNDNNSIYIIERPKKEILLA